MVRISAYEYEVVTQSWPATIACNGQITDMTNNCIGLITTSDCTVGIENRVTTFLENLEKSGNFFKSEKSQGKQAKSGKSWGNHDCAILSASITNSNFTSIALRMYIFA